MKTLNKAFYRVAPDAHDYQQVPITRTNIDAALDRGVLQVAMRNGNWWTIRRNGKTQTWKRNPDRVRIPFKMGLYGHGAIEAHDFVEQGEYVNLRPCAK